MPISRRPSGPATCAALAAVLALALVGCADDGRDAAAPPATPSGTGTPAVDEPDVSGMPVPADLARVFTRVLDRRARALIEADRAGFESGLGPDPRFRAEQRRYFTNLRQLPLASLTFRLERASLVRERDDYWVVVDVGTELSGFDQAAVHTLDRYRFSRTGGRRFRLTSVRDPEWEKANDAEGQPWDTGRIHVRSGSGVLAVLDGGTLDEADRVVDAVERGIADVRPRVPYGDWNGSVVVYALSDTRFLESLDDLTGDPTAVDGVTVSLPASPRNQLVVATRVVLSPQALSDGGPMRLERLVRHELTHVAIGVHDDRAPLWLSEGVAEWVSVRALAPEDRTIDPAAVAAAEAGELDRLPEEAEFEGSDPDVAYALAWWVCEWISVTYGEQGVWTVLDGLSQPDVDPAEETARLLRVSRSQLARRGAALLLRTYDRRQQPDDPPSGSPSGSPSAVVLARAARVAAGRAGTTVGA